PRAPVPPPHNSRMRPQRRSTVELDYSGSSPHFGLTSVHEPSALSMNTTEYVLLFDIPPRRQTSSTAVITSPWHFCLSTSGWKIGARSRASLKTRATSLTGARYFTTKARSPFPTLKTLEPITEYFEPETPVTSCVCGVAQPARVQRPRNTAASDLLWIIMGRPPWFTRDMRNSHSTRKHPPFSVSETSPRLIEGKSAAVATS